MLKRFSLLLMFFVSFSAVFVAWAMFFTPQTKPISSPTKKNGFFEIDLNNQLNDTGQVLEKIVKGDQLKRINPEITKTKKGVSVTLSQISFRNDATWVFLKIKNNSQGAIKLPLAIELWQNNKPQIEITKQAEEDLPLKRTLAKNEEVQGVVYFSKVNHNKELIIFLEGVFSEDTKTNFVFRIN